MVCSPVLRSVLSAPKQGLHFWVLHLRRFLSIYRLHWCKHGTTVKGSPEFRKFTLTSPYAMHEIRYFAGPYCEVGFLHQNKVYIFGFSTSVASFPYIDCIGANTVPRWKVAPSFANLHWRPYTRCMKLGGFPFTSCEVGFLHQNKVYIFGFSTSVASFPYIDCIGANTVPRWKVAPSFANLHWRPYTRCMKLGGLQSRTAKWAFCTRTRFTFLGSPPP